MRAPAEESGAQKKRMGGEGGCNLAGDENEAEASSLCERPAEAVFGRGSD